MHYSDHERMVLKLLFNNNYNKIGPNKPNPLHEEDGDR
jgi:hypothetical protein